MGLLYGKNDVFNKAVTKIESDWNLFKVQLVENLAELTNKDR